MAGPDDRREGSPRHIHIERKDKRLNWLPWLLLALGLVALLFALSRCGRDESAAIAPAANAVDIDDTSGAQAPAVVATTPYTANSAALAGTSGLGSYLAGTEPTPRTFTFERLNFDTAKSGIRAADAVEVDGIAAALGRHPSAKVRIAGYADARGDATANEALGKARAESVKQALVAKGVDADRIETASGGETEPVDTNATGDGRFENRRTELVVTAR